MMTKEQARALQVGRDKFFVTDLALEVVYEMSVSGVNLATRSDPSSAVNVLGFGKTMTNKVYTHREIHSTEIEALQALAELHQFRSDQALDKKHAVIAKIAKLKAKGAKV